MVCAPQGSPQATERKKLARELTEVPTTVEESPLAPAVLTTAPAAVRAAGVESLKPTFPCTVRNVMSTIVTGAARPAEDGGEVYTAVTGRAAR